MLNVLVDRCTLDNSHPIISVLTLCPLLELVLHIGNLSFRYLHISVVCQCCMSSSSSIPPYFQCKTLPVITRALDMSCPRKSEANFDPFQVSFITISQQYSSHLHPTYQITSSNLTPSCRFTQNTDIPTILLLSSRSIQLATISTISLLSYCFAQHTNYVYI